MSRIDTKARSALGEKTRNECLATTSVTPQTLFDASWRDYLFAEVWPRAGLDRRSRYFIAIATATCSGASRDVVDGYIRGALSTLEISLSELREAALHLAVYAGWGRGRILDDAVTRVAGRLGLPASTYEPIQRETWDKQRRLDIGQKNFTDVMVFPAPPPATPYFEAGIINFVFAEMWRRPALDERSRRWVTLACVADSSSTTPIRTHTYAAMASGNATLAEMQEFVLQYAVDGGWPKASVMQAVVFEMGKRVADGLPYE